MDNRMIAHLWANEKKESVNGGNFFFEGESIYSYGYHFEAGRIVRNKRGEKAYLINSIHYSSTTSKHQYFVRNAIPTDSKVFSVGYNMSNTGNMAFVTSKLESIKDAIEKYKKVRTELPYHNVWGVFRNMMDYIEFFDMGTPQRLLKKSANDWLGTNHELSRESDKVKREYVRELKRIFQILLDYQPLEVLGTVNVIVDEVCGEGTWIKYLERIKRFEKSREEKEKIKIETYRKEQEARNKTLKERVQIWKSGEISQLYYHCFNNDQPNVWLRVKNGKIETSKGIKITRTEGERLWRLIKTFHNGGQFKHDLALDVTGHRWAFNRYENDILTAGCHRIAYSEMEGIARQLGWD